MSIRIDLVVGPVRAAELVKTYAWRLRVLDQLGERAALSVACEAFAAGCVYVIAAPGQTWVRRTGEPELPAEIRLGEIGFDPRAGHCASYTEQCGISGVLALDTLQRHYDLAFWPVAHPIEGITGI